MSNRQSRKFHLDDFTKGNIIGTLKKGRSVTNVAEKFCIARFMCIERMSNNRTVFRGFSSYSTETADTIAKDHDILLQTKNRQHANNEISGHSSWHELLDVEYHDLLQPKIGRNVVFYAWTTIVACTHFLWYQNTRTEHNRNKVEKCLRMRAPIKSAERFSCIHI